MKKIFSILLVGLSITAGYSQTIVSNESFAEFEISNMGLGSVEGKIKGMAGTIVFDKNNLASSRFNVIINPKTIDTDSKKRDEHLQNEDFFNVKAFEDIRFVSEKIIKNGSGYVAKGRLTLHGKTNDMDLPFTISEFGNKIKFYGEIEVNRFDYGLAAESYKSTFMVGEIADVKITCVAIK